MTAYRQYLKHTDGLDAKLEFGRQFRPISGAVVFVVPSPSPANAGFSLGDLVGWYRVVADWLRT